jgi:putative tryptophan/tyrosine transport system substrate-binding protein
MRRRELIILLGGAAAAWPFAVRAQQKPMPVIGLLSPFTPADTEPWYRAFRQGLGDLGWVAGANLKLEYRYSNGQNERLPELVAELIKLKVDLIVVAITTDANAAAKATKTIPIVMASTGDPIATGLIASLARPGGNVTGLTQMSTDLATKRLQLLDIVEKVVAGKIRAVLNNNDSRTQS